MYSTNSSIQWLRFVFSSCGALYSLLKKQPWEITRNPNCRTRRFQSNRIRWCLAWITWLRIRRARISKFALWKVDLEDRSTHIVYRTIFIAMKSSISLMLTWNASVYENIIKHYIKEIVNPDISGLEVCNKIFVTLWMPCCTCCSKI